MQTEIYKTLIVLHTYRKNPKITKNEMATILTNKSDNSEANEPFTDSEIEEMKTFLKKNSPSVFYKSFPEEIKTKSPDDRISDELWVERMKSGNIEKWDKDHEMSLAIVDGLRKGSIESVERSERYDKIYAIEKTKWPHDMGSKLRSDIPEELQEEFDQCIENSQKIAREACQTEELTKTYLKNNKTN